MGKRFKSFLILLLSPNFDWYPSVVPIQNRIRWPGCQPRWLPSANIVLTWDHMGKCLKIISETAWPTWTKLWWHGLSVISFQNYLKWPWIISKMAIVSRNNFNKGSYRKNVKNLLHSNSFASWDQTMMVWSLADQLLYNYIRFTTMHSKWLPSADTVLIQDTMRKNV